MKHIVKRAGHKEMFDERKLYASIFSACMVTRMSNQLAESVAEKVTMHVASHLERKNEITAKEIKDATYEVFKQYDADAAYLYRHHKDLV